MKFEVKLIIFMILFLVSISSAVAEPVRGAEIEECSCTLISNPIEITNTGTRVDGYHITQFGRAAEFSEVLPNVVILDPGETAVVDNFINMLKQRCLSAYNNQFRAINENIHSEDQDY